MRFYVIYTVDAPRDGWSIKSYHPPKVRQWQLTERADKFDPDDVNCNFEGYDLHRKYVAEIDRETFDQLVSDQGLWPQECETMGSLTEFGLLPAISFDNEPCYRDDPILNAYVTPLPEVRGKIPTGMNERDWQRIRKAVIAHYHW